MDQTLHFVFQECLRTVACRSKLLTRHFTRMKVSPCLFAKHPEIVYVDLNSILTEGRGLQWFTPDGLNSITLKFRSVEAIKLPCRSVKVQFSRQEADVVDVKRVNGCIFEILYRADGADALGLKITVCDQIVCQTTAQLGMSAETAMAELERMQQPVNPARCVAILTCWCDNSVVVKEVLRRLSALTFSEWTAVSPASLLLDVMSRNIADAEIQWCGLLFLNGLVLRNRVEEVLSFNGWDTCIFNGMNNFPYDLDVQYNACALIRNIAKRSASGKEILLSGLASGVVDCYSAFLARRIEGVS